MTKKEIIIEDTPYVQHSKEHAMKLSVVEGSVFQAGRNMTGSFLTPYALTLGANNFHIGLMSAIAGLLGPLGQLRGSRLMEKHSRKKILEKSKLIVNLMWVPIIGLSYLAWKGHLTTLLPYLLIIFWAGIITYSWGAGHVAWFSWMGDLVPEKIRGRYLSRRSRTEGIIGLIAFVIGAFILDYYKTKGLVLVGFTTIFIIGIIFRTISKKITTKIFNPKFRIKKGYYLTLKQYFAKEEEYKKFSYFQATYHFAIMIATPFIAVHMLTNLGFSYVTFTAVTLSSTAFYLLFAPLAGKFSDKYGNVKLLKIAVMLFPLVPVLWIKLQNPIALILAPGLISGMANAAFINATTNHTYESLSPQKRSIYSAYNSLLIGVGTLAGSLLGGVLLQTLATQTLPAFVVFALSAIMMVLTSLFFVPQIKEVKKKERLKGLSTNISHPFKTIQSDIVWAKNFIIEK